MRTPATISKALESVFDGIRAERMAEVPILNDALRVEAVGFREFGDNFLGVLVTPWFMNLMLLPGEAGAWDEDRPGEKLRHTLPAGDFEFIAGHEDGIGHYRMCSLFSPMFEFADHEAAVETAAAVMEGVLKAHDAAGEAETPAKKPLSRRELFRQLAGGA